MGAASEASADDDVDYDDDDDVADRRAGPSPPVRSESQRDADPAVANFFSLGFVRRERLLAPLFQKRETYLAVSLHLSPTPHHSAQVFLYFPCFIMALLLSSSFSASPPPGSCRPPLRPDPNSASKRGGLPWKTSRYQDVGYGTREMHPALF